MAQRVALSRNRYSPVASRMRRAARKTILSLFDGTGDQHRFGPTDDVGSDRPASARERPGIRRVKIFHFLSRSTSQPCGCLARTRAGEIASGTSEVISSLSCRVGSSQVESGRVQSGRVGPVESRRVLVRSVWSGLVKSSRVTSGGSLSIVARRSLTLNGPPTATPPGFSLLRQGLPVIWYRRSTYRDT